MMMIFVGRGTRGTPFSQPFAASAAQAPFSRASCQANASMSKEEVVHSLAQVRPGIEHRKKLDRSFRRFDFY